MELAPAEPPRPGNPGGPRQPRGHYELRQQVIRDRPVDGVYVLMWIPDAGSGSSPLDDRPHQEMVITDGRIPLLAETLAAFLVDAEMPFSAKAQGSLRRAGVPFPVPDQREGDDDGR